MTAINQNTLSKEQLDLIERFITSYNTIDRHLRDLLKADQSVTFSQLANEYAVRNPCWRDRETLRMAGDLRNVVVHQRQNSYEYLSVPIPSVVENLERIKDHFKSPERVFPKFRRDVIIFQSNDVMSDVLKCINETSFSQFPIYDQKRYLGLLTENGITRWLARHSTTIMTLVELNDILVKDVFNQEEERHNCQFISRHATLMDAENQFVRNTILEALLITEKGKPEETLMGIITGWDVLAL